MDYIKLISEGISLHTSIKSTVIEPLIEVPPRPEMGDYSFPCFYISKLLKKDPCSIANELKTKLKLQGLNKIDVVGPYVNFYIDTVEFIKNTIEKILSDKDSYGSSMHGKGKTVVVNLSFPILAESFKINHLFAALIGNSLTKIYNFAGYNCLCKNSINDIDNAFGKLMIAFKRGWIDEKMLISEPRSILQRSYLKFQDEIEIHPSFKDEAVQHYRRLEEGQEPEANLFKIIKTLCLNELYKIYKILNLKFDSFDENDIDSYKLSEVVKNLADKNLLHDFVGAKVILLKEYNLPPCVIERSDGSITSSTKDLAEVIFTEKLYDIHRTIYISDNSKTIYYNQLFTILRLLGSSCCDTCVHVGLGRVKFLDKELSVKREAPGFIEYIFKYAVKESFDMLKDYDFENKTEIAQKMGVGSVIFALLHNYREKDNTIAWKELLNNGDHSCPYILYTYYRARSTTNNSYYIPFSDDYSRLGAKEELELIKLLSCFSDKIIESLNNLDPSVIAGYVLMLARKLDHFLNLNNIVELKDEELQKAKIKLVEAACQVLKNGLHLLGIEVFEKN